MTNLILGLIASYILGSLPTAYIFGRVLKDVDIRKFGSGNVGATNAFRVLGKPVGIVVLLIDILKGFLSVTLLGNIFSGVSFVANDTLRIIFGLACISGHNWTIFLRFKGGKGMASTLGVLSGLALQIPELRIVLGLTALVWIVVFSIVRIVSFASVASAIVLPIVTIGFTRSRTLMVLTFILSVLAVFRHKSNLKRIFKKEEKPLF